MNRKNIGSLLIAVALIGAGIAYFCRMVLGWHLFWFAGWWCALLAVVALLSMVSHGLRYWNSLLLGSAGLLYLWQSHFIIHSLRKLWSAEAALALVLLGVMVIAHMVRPPRKAQAPYVQNDPNAPSPQPEEWEREATWEPQSGRPNAPMSSEDFPTRFALFSSDTLRSDCKRLRGARLTAIFGGVLADLRAADFEQPITVEVNALFGGADILVPPNVRVECAGTAIFGGCDAKQLASRPYDPGHPPLRIRYLTIFGGLDVK